MSAPVRIMFDIETLSTSPNACVLSIGAVVFGSLHETKAHPTYPREFYVNVNDPDGQIDLSTILWWFKQSPEAQQRVLGERAPLHEALKKFFCWCSMHATGTLNEIQDRKSANVEFWSRSPSFDEVILETAYRRSGVLSPFFHRWSRDCRTIEMIAGLPYDPTLYRTALAHDALEDARTQAKHVMACFAKLQIN